MRPLGHQARAVKGAQTAYQKGADAAKAGKPISACPYPQTASSEHVDFGRKWRKKWLDGYRSIKPEKEVMPP